MIKLNKAYIVTDLGPGDGGKGGVVHKISHMMHARMVIKEGGAQGSHGVCTFGGMKFNFSQWGCGTLEGVPTHISHRFVVHPEGLLNEAEALRYQCGIHNAFDLLTVDQNALCVTPYHGIASRLRELSLRDKPRGTIGTGVGEAFRDDERTHDLSIYVRDLKYSKHLRDLLAAIREAKLYSLKSIIQGKFLPADQELAAAEIRLLYDDGFLDYIVERFKEAAKQTKIVDHDYFRREILSPEGIVVIEKSHGILTDNHYGFHPHTSAIRTLPCFTRQMLKEAGYDGEIVNIGVTRAYCIRHGAGPMPTADPDMAEHLLPGSNKDENRYQGKIRVGPMDLVLLRYAIEVCDGPEAFDGLAITWFDQILTNGAWQVCESYANTCNEKYFTPGGELIVFHGARTMQYAHQEALGKKLLSCIPEFTSIGIPPNSTRNELFELCAGFLKDKLKIPVRMVSFGPTEREKVCK